MEGPLSDATRPDSNHDIKVTLGSFTKSPTLILGSVSASKYLAAHPTQPKQLVLESATKASLLFLLLKYSCLPLTVDRSHQPAGIPGIADTLVISVKFPRDTQILVEEVVGNVAGRTSPLPDALLTRNCSSVQFFLPEPAIVKGFGLPFSNPGHPSEG